MIRLTDYANDTFSQFGEDGCIAHIFEQMGERSRVCVEFGAGDGLSCSNTARLWRSQGWSAVLVEADLERFDFLEVTAKGFDAITEHTFVTPQGPDSIDAILARHCIEQIDFMSIDIDGDDYAILESLTIRPRVICIEFNPTVPPHISLHQRDLGGTFGASLGAIVSLAGTKGYRFLGATHCNAFLIEGAEPWVFDGYETDRGVLFPLANYTYAVTDLAGRVVLCGAPLPWGARESYSAQLCGSSTFPVNDDPEWLRRSSEAAWGPALSLTPDDLAAETVELSREKLRLLLASAVAPLVVIDLTNLRVGEEEWMLAVADANFYGASLSGRVLSLIRR